MKSNRNEPRHKENRDKRKGRNSRSDQAWQSPQGRQDGQDKQNRSNRQGRPTKQGRIEKREQQDRYPVKQQSTEALVAERTEDFVFGHYAALEALENDRGNKLFLQEDLSGEKVEKLKEAAKAHAVPVKWVPKQKLDTLSDRGVHQGVVLATTAYEYLTLEQLLETTTTETPFFLILDSIEDPHNLGSIVRTADAAGVDGIIIPKHRAVGVTSVVVKASTGAVEHVPIARVTNLGNAIAELKKSGFWIFGTDMQGTDYRSWNTAGAIALIIGNEGRGMSKGLLKEVDELLTIPMVGHVQSLNAGVAAGLLMYEVYRGRNPKG